MLVDVWMDGKGITGKDAEKALEAANITVNKNTIPFDQNKPVRCFGPAHRHAGRHHARHERTGDARDWPLIAVDALRLTDAVGIPTGDWKVVFHLSDGSTQEITRGTWTKNFVREVFEDDL
jgi:hypothetical protein